MGTVLVVDDSRTQRHMLKGLLSDYKFRVSVAKNGADALAQVQQASPDVVVLDIVMPEMNGYEVCRHLKKNPTTQDIPVIMCSTKNEKFDQYWGLKNGADAYVAKPFQREELIDAIRQVIRDRNS